MLVRLDAKDSCTVLLMCLVVLGWEQMFIWPQPWFGCAFLTRCYRQTCVLSLLFAERILTQPILINNPINNQTPLKRRGPCVPKDTWPLHDTRHPCDAISLFLIRISGLLSAILPFHSTPWIVNDSRPDLQRPYLTRTLCGLWLLAQSPVWTPEHQAPELERERSSVDRS